MLLTTSKHASKELQALARRLASHVPECRYLPRSERALERLQTLATRAGEDTLLVLASPQTERPSQGKKKKPQSAAKKASPPLAIISSRTHSSGGWVWHPQTLALSHISFSTPLPPPVKDDDPLEIKITAGKPSHALSSFLGLAAGKRSPLFADSTLVTLKAMAKKTEIKLSKTLLTQFEYAWC